MTPKITVVHILRTTNPDVQYIGRSSPAHSLKASPLANPFKITAGRTREEVIQKYHEALKVSLEDANSEPSQELIRLASFARQHGLLELGCWCSPAACHGDVIREELLKMLEVKDA
jgi:Domain of unknown function (DUF4326)